MSRELEQFLRDMFPERREPEPKRPPAPPPWRPRFPGDEPPF